MKKKLYVELTYPDGIDFSVIDLEQLVYNEVHSRLVELGVSQSALDDYKQFDVLTKKIEAYSKEFDGVNDD